MPPSRLIGGQELDGLLGSESPSKEVDSSCWGRKKKKKKSLQEDTVSVVLLNKGSEQLFKSAKSLNCSHLFNMCVSVNGTSLLMDFFGEN